MKLWLKLFDGPPEDCESRFVITEDGAWFVPYRRELHWPPMTDSLEAIFDLDDPAVHDRVDSMLEAGR